MFLVLKMPPPLSKGSAASHPIQIESEPQKKMPLPEINPNAGKSPISKSLDDIINIVKNSQQGKSPNYNNIDTRVKTLEESMISISNLCSNISLKLDLVIDNSCTNSTRLSAVQCKIYDSGGVFPI